MRRLILSANFIRQINHKTDHGTKHRKPTGATLFCFACSTVLLVCTLSFTTPVSADPPANNAANSGIRPELTTLLQRSTEIYKNAKTYQHTAEYLVRNDQGIKEDTAYTLALERPNKFCYKSDNENAAAAVSNGKVFVSFLGHESFTRITAPATLKEIDLVGDVAFKPFATRLIALMLQGDILADPDIKTALQKAPAPVTVTEDNKRFDTVTAPLTSYYNTQVTLYFDAQTHLLHKAVIENSFSRVKVTEIIENVKIDKPVDPTVFQYTPPKTARLIAKSSRNKTIDISDSRNHDSHSR